MLHISSIASLLRAVSSRLISPIIVLFYFTLWVSSVGWAANSSAANPGHLSAAVAPCGTCQDRKTVTEKNREDLHLVSQQVPGDWSSVPAIRNYSQSAKTLKMIAAAMRKKRSYFGGQCYKFVKNALVEAKWVDKRPPSYAARSAIKDLAQEGFINLLAHPKYSKWIQGPSSTPKGAVLVYSSEHGFHLGHTEIKTEDGERGGYVGDTFRKNSVVGSLLTGRSGRGYHLIGVMIKPVGDL